MGRLEIDWNLGRPVTNLCSRSIRTGIALGDLGYQGVPIFERRRVLAANTQGCPYVLFITYSDKQSIPACFLCYRPQIIVESIVALMHELSPLAFQFAKILLLSAR